MSPEITKIKWFLNLLFVKIDSLQFVIEHESWLFQVLSSFHAVKKHCT